MKAVILAAGQGTRLRPVTLTMPKPLVPVANKHLIVYAIEVLKNAGLTDIGIVINSLESPIKQTLNHGENLGVTLEYIIQEEQKGLAHAISLCQDFVGDESFCVVLGDNIFQDKMENLLREFPESDAEASIALYEVPDPSRFGIAEVNGEQIIRVVEKPKDPPSNLAICGVYLFRSSIFDAIRQIKPSWRNELEITDAIQELISAQKKVHQYTLKGWWIDAGKPNAIIQANHLVLGDMPYTPAPESPNITNSDVSHRVILGENTQVIDSVIRGPVIIGDNVIIKNSYVGPYTAIGDNVVIENSEIEASIVMRECKLLNLPGRRIDSSLIADNTEVVSSATQVPSVHRLILAENSYVQL
ncbi:MAG: glucose-1-phosphate thymidylyltransferase [Phototrophicales bacterium]|nr:MAG: glucose-1-phosphate thymidylyltransferase [Phototrophicales bacterium]RMG70555.1 MAG: glucose-1-phosphate thymidylyltransferase [Chloroflexota bacterium]